MLSIVPFRGFRGQPASRAIGIIFALCGLGFGTWASFIPYVKQTFHLDEAQLGLLLLCLPLGNFIANPLTVILIRRSGAVRIALVAGSFTAFFFAVPVSLPSITYAAIGLFLAGGTFGITNVAMNTLASAYETQTSKKIMSTCHGMWSVGAMLGSLISGLAILPLERFFDYGGSPQTKYVFSIAFIILIITWMIRNDLVSISRIQIPSGELPKISWRAFKPTRILWMLITICLCTYLTEGTMADWSAVYLKEIVIAPATIAGWGFAVYSFCMAAGRFVGDRLIARYGAMQILRAGGLLVFAGLIIVILSQNPWVALPGFMLVGMGISLASPILYSSAANVSGLAPGVGLATLNTFAMASFFGGPVLIGFIGKMADLRIAFMFVAVASIIWLIQTTRLLRILKSSTIQ
ncbi:MAG TPA: MFS transporter [Saprospiraceae bacterium]|nr:MFS transporter [Saprospiraceae bacterium]